MILTYGPQISELMSEYFKEKAGTASIYCTGILLFPQLILFGISMVTVTKGAIFVAQNPVDSKSGF